MHLGDLHTLFNYFSVALIVTGIIYELLGRMRARATMTEFGWNALLIGVGCTVLSVVTGFLAESSAFISEKASTVAMLHRFASLGAFFFVVLLVCYRLLFVKKMDVPETGAGLRGGYVVLQMITVIAMLFAAIIGIRLVKGFGVGVEPYEQIQTYMPPPVKPQDIQVDTTEFLK